MDTKITFRKTFGHLKTVLIHKWWVFYYACKLGIPWRGIKHDMSKFSPVEFWESVRYWTGTSSPIPLCKQDKGYSLAWQHHKGRNPHHYEYWIDYLDQGGVPIKMPWKDVLELTADYLGAGRAYQGKNFTLQGEFEWFRKKLATDNPKMHFHTKVILENMFYYFAHSPHYLEYFKFYAPGFKKTYESMND